MSGQRLFGPIFGIDFFSMGENQQAQSLSNYALVAKYAPMIAQWQRVYQQLLGQANYFRAPQKPLDERFADFKRRLDAVVAKRRRK